MRVPVRFMAACLTLALASPLRAQSTAALVTSDTTAAANTSAARVAPIAPLTAITPVVTERAVPASNVSAAAMSGMRSGVHAREASRPAQPMAMRGNLGQSRAMMVVGVAALIAGAIIGGTPGTVIMVGGAVVGLLGLYDYLQ